ncbi:hypothetical protein L2E82_15958 [Cichorium intybus]|uniref:Uncharacterized protein n=1 Tax=Cichorium intybus TaxID=13427 RepID=A0ACB9F5G7_CICIN|nr:hypothetical protein L2E82_15958 [Cichorium intybus]
MGRDPTRYQIPPLRSGLDYAKSSLLLRERRRFSPTRYFVDDVIAECCFDGFNFAHRDEKLQEMKEFEEEGEKLMKLHEEKKAEMKSSHWKEEIDLEEGFNTDLMDKYTPKDKVQ